MSIKRTVAAILALGLVTTISIAAEQSLEGNWNDFLHYTAIGRLDLAKGYAKAVLGSNPDPVALLELSESNPQGYDIMLRVKETASDKELTELTGNILDIIEKGKFVRRTDPKVIIDEIKRLSTTDRGRLTAVKRLQNAGEYAIPHMLEAIASNPNKEELSNVLWALPQIGKDSIRPLTAALQTDNIDVKAEIIKALGKIGYPQSLGYLKYVVEKDSSAELKKLAEESIKEIDPAAQNLPTAQLLYQLADNYYYHSESLAPAEDANFGNIWFWDTANKRLSREQVDKRYFYELMAMRSCEWALKADPNYGQAIGLWIASFFKAESTGVKMPAYFGANHADTMTYATTAGPEYLYQALSRAIKDKDAYVALGAVEALSATAGEKTLLYQLGPGQPLTDALTFDDKAVKYSAAIAIALAGPKERFPESKGVVDNLAAAIGETAEKAGQTKGLWNAKLADSYAVRAAKAMLQIAQTENPVIDLSTAQDTLIEATKDKRPEIQILAGEILAHLKTPEAQRAIAAMALKDSNSENIRIEAFKSLAISAKFNGNLLSNEVDAIYSLISSKDANPALRSAAAGAFGSLNLPSQKVKDLILSQARS